MPGARPDHTFVVLRRVLAPEFELFQLLLDHPHRFYTAAQITGFAWSDSALFPEEVRNYVLRIRKILARLEIQQTWSTDPDSGTH